MLRVFCRFGSAYVTFWSAKYALRIFVANSSAVRKCTGATKTVKQNTRWKGLALKTKGRKIWKSDLFSIFVAATIAKSIVTPLNAAKSVLQRKKGDDNNSHECLDWNVLYLGAFWATCHCRGHHINPRFYSLSSKDRLLRQFYWQDRICDWNLDGFSKEWRFHYRRFIRHGPQKMCLVLFLLQMLVTQKPVPN